MMQMDALFDAIDHIPVLDCHFILVLLGQFPSCTGGQVPGITLSHVFNRSLAIPQPHWTHRTLVLGEAYSVVLYSEVYI